ncbi:MAG: carboxymuconolactone decarboxylase family protein [Acidobacteria bacterium]|nr:carboxymuconolactone decarboxylase family protein [Acidobacteriota bacterium]
MPMQYALLVLLLAAAAGSGVPNARILRVGVQMAQTASSGPLPRDIHPDSRNRLPLPKPGVEGVAAIRLHASGVDVRWSSPLGRNLTELAILTAARAHDQPYEWSLHEMEALAVSLDPKTIDVVRHNRPLAGVPEKAAVIVAMGREIFGRHALGADTYARALKVLGTSNLVDVVILMGNYAATATRLTAFNQQMPPGWKQLLPLPFTPPDDIHPDTRSRLPYLKAQAGATPGPLYSRGLAPEGTGPGLINRHGSGMKLLEAGVGRRTMALAVLVTSHEHHQPYHWARSAAAAQGDGVEPAVIDAVRQDRPLTGLDEKDAAVVQFARELFRRHTVAPATYQRALKIFGERNLVDLVDLMARTVNDLTLLTAFDQR